MESTPPYFRDTAELWGLADHIESHLRCLLNTTATWYLGHGWRPGFHTVFYALSYGEGTFGQWPHGDLYGDEIKRTFGKQTFTVKLPPRIMPYTAYTDCSKIFARSTESSEWQDLLSAHWTILVLAPARWSNTERELERYRDIVDLSKMTRLEAEVQFIAIGLSLICNEWAEVTDFFANILEEDANSILSPNDHDQLFYDDAVFSRSRRYFWAIDTLTQIDSYISDNIHQWTKYKEYRIQSMIDDIGKIPKIDWLDLADSNCAELIQKRDLFRKYLASFQLLRDGVSEIPQILRINH